MRFVLSIILLFAPLKGYAGEEIKLYDQPVGGVYYQTWYGHLLGDTYQNNTIVYVVGEGKLGHFYGLLELDCLIATNSRWLTEGGFLNADLVPREAIQNLRKQFC